jgi:hypothetical protein
MQKIYGLAKHVFFHIGRDTLKAERCIEGQFPEKNRRIWQQWARRGWPLAIMKAVASVLDHSEYARRLWVVQELVLGRQVSLVMANWIVPFPDLADAGALGSIDIARQRWHREGVKGSPLIELLKFYSRHHCKEKVDRVFGLLGICSDRIPIDYNMSPQWIAIEILAYLIFKEPDLPLSNRSTHEMNRTRRMTESIMRLQSALDFQLQDEDYANLSKRLEQTACQSSNKETYSYWWYSPTVNGFRDNLLYRYGWDPDYDSTAEWRNVKKKKKVKKVRSTHSICPWFRDPADEFWDTDDLRPWRREKGRTSKK